ncbi:phospholipase D family protein [Microbacterium sp. nov. GSS16]|uniref:phospholipase D family protein n=1 Tax=Microbacterium sp. nov. GSS16 TaxID=3019890 RepID=UPI00230528AB|nr:phospholipase D family protein [Microbacterium sp. nov. GSS16]WCD93275.1 phospholipase D family protein [Microbacterium sp. nov. GSS16]
MLEPQGRAALTEQLTPPVGYQLSHAVGTTFTLDLLTALSIPLSFASRRLSSADDRLGVLDAVRRSADRVDVFAQAGEVGMGKPSDLVALLEPMIHPVAVRRGLFHPKVWFLEYRSGDRLSYRFLCASRNLTEDRSWDTLVRLDGAAGEDAEPTNAPLVSLLRTLPRLSVVPLPDERRTRIERLAARLQNVTWEHPSDVRSVDFHVFGMPDSVQPDVSGIRSLIISPFVSEDALQTLRRGVRGPTHLISRAATLDRLPAECDDDRLRTYVLDDAAVIPDDSDDDAASGTGADRLTGLHAKVIVTDRAAGAQVLIGSANATGAALSHNVEVMVRMTGATPRLGVDATLAALGDLTAEYAPDWGASELADEAAQRRLEALVRGLAQVRFTARVAFADPWSLTVWAADAEDTLTRLSEAEVSLRWHLLTRTDLGQPLLSLTEAQATPLTGIPLTDITPFLVLVARDAAGNERRTVVLAELLDDVPDRKDAIVARQLTDQATFLRLLALLLDLGGDAVFGGVGSGGAFGAGSDGPVSGLFEALVRSIGADGDGLVEARRIIDFIRRHEETDQLLPPEFEELWANVWSAHDAVTRRR